MKRHCLAHALVALLLATSVRAADDKELAKLLRQLKDKKADKRIEASEALVRKRAVSAVPALAEALKDPDPTVRYNAAAALINLKDDARPALPALREALADSDIVVGVAAASALRNLDEPSTVWMPVVRRAARDPNPDARKAAEELLKLADTGDLQEAAQAGQTEAVRGLLDAGAQVNKADKNRRTALHYAAQKDHLDVVRLLLERGADVNAADKNHRTALHIAAGNGDVEMVNLLLARGADLLAKEVHNGAAPIHFAAQEGKSEVVKLFLTKGVDISLPDNTFRGPLFYAAAGGHTGLVRMLLDRKALTKLPGLQGQAEGTPLHAAAEGGHIATMELLLARGVPLNAGRLGGETALGAAAAKGQLEAMKFLMARGMKADSVEPGYVRFPLLEAVSNGQLEAVRLLLENKANPNAKDDAGKTPLAIAIENKDEATAALLRRYGAQ